MQEKKMQLFSSPFTGSRLFFLAPQIVLLRILPANTLQNSSISSQLKFFQTMSFLLRTQVPVFPAIERRLACLPPHSKTSAQDLPPAPQMQSGYVFQSLKSITTSSPAQSSIYCKEIMFTWIISEQTRGGGKKRERERPICQ